MMKCKKYVGGAFSKFFRNIIKGNNIFLVKGGLKKK